ncbi:MAG: anthranilate synthase component I family protein [Bacteroidetes bacterium]|nr:anthranilate synthase component I family protein [Bacteroidota bacterium]
MWPGGLSLPDGTVAIIPLTPDQHAYLKDEAEARDIPLAMLLIQKVGQIKEHIQQGDIYEMNFCQEFYADNAVIDPVEVYMGLNEKSPAPFSCFYKFKEKFLISSSPERFLKKTGNKIISQPIKGTVKRGKSDVEDVVLKEILAGNAKEQSENVMIVDLVRNDLSRSARLGTVEVEELFGIYSFEQVHHMISTVSAELKDDIHLVDVIKNAFPMGSMTGAPKVSSMKLIEKYEESKRGLFSGSIGYITPSGDFDFNVVIRSILYNEANQYVSFTTGSAITINSNAEKEYEECHLKGKALRQVLNSTYV